MTTLWEPPQPAQPAPDPDDRPHLRPYQKEAVDAVWESLQDNRSALVVAPTGTGKTVIMAQLINECSGRVLILAHQGKLLQQASEKIQWLCDITPDVEKGEDWASARFPSSVIVSTWQTQHSGMNGHGRRSRFDPNDFSLVLVDEAHRSLASTYRKTLEYYQQNPNLRIVGVTATPDRGDERALGQVYEDTAYAYWIDDAIKDGWLVPIKENRVAVSDLDLSGVSESKGDLSATELSQVLEEETPLHEMAHPTYEIAGDRKTLIYCASVKHAKLFTEILNRWEPNCARVLHGGLPEEDRQTIYRDYAAGRFRFLANVDVAAEGFDEPTVQVIAVARPTKSRAKYAQMVGRGTRPLAGIVDGLAGPEDRRAAIESSNKPFCEVIDFAGNAGHHKLMSVADVLGGKYDEEVVEKAKRLAERRTSKDGESVPADVGEELDRAQQALEQERKEAEELAKRKHIKGKAQYEKLPTDPFSLLNVKPRKLQGWDKEQKATDKQAAMLEKHGIDASDMPKKHASQLISQIIGRQQNGWCSPKQAKVLAKAGLNPKGIRFKQASQIIDKLKSNGWKPNDEIRQMAGGKQ